MTGTSDDLDVCDRATGPEGDDPPGATRDDAAETGTAAPSRRKGGDSADATRILIIDDDEHVTRLIARVLRREGIDVLSAPDGAAGLAHFRERADEIALVVLDLSMPGLSGEETLAGLREVSDSVPVLLSSGLPPQEVSTRFERLGANGFLQKPYTARRLVRTIRELLGP